MTFTTLAIAALLALSPAPKHPVATSTPVAPRAAPPAPRPLPAGVYVASRYNRRALPAVDRIASEKGFEHYVKLDECVLTLRGDGRFVASAKYYHEHMAVGTPVPPRARLTDSYRGTYAVRGAQITLYPDRPSKKQPQPDPIQGTVAGDRIALAFPINSGTIRRQFAFDFAKDPNRF